MAAMATPIYFPGVGVAWRIVRRVTTWDGRTVGVVRWGGEFVVEQRDGRWSVLSGVSVAEVYGPGRRFKARTRLT